MQKAGVLLSLHSKAVKCQDLAELGFLIANETWHLLPYRQACFFTPDAMKRPALRSVTGLVNTQETSPLTLWLTRLAVWLDENFSEPSARVFTVDDIPDAMRSEWVEWWPSEALFVPLVQPGGKGAGKRLGFVIYVREESWTEQEQQLLALLHETYSQVIGALRTEKVTLAEKVQHALIIQRRWQWLVAFILVILMLPLRTTVLAPAEVIAMDSETVATPLDGVVEEFFVEPNAPVTKGQALFKLDDTTLRNRREVAEKAVAVARADVLTARQKAFDDPQSKAELAVLLGRQREKESELAFLQAQLEKTTVFARHAGVFIYSDANDWLGRPVSTGERIGQLAQPDKLGVEVWLPVNDAINLQEGSEMNVYLQVEPLTALEATLSQTSYQAVVSPDGVAAYRVRGQLQAAPKFARIGLRGVAKLYGERRVLIYSALRRPLGAVRQWLGV